MVELAEYRKQRTKKKKRNTVFTRPELRQLLDVYSRRVASGEWRDYAIDFHGSVAVFSVFRHSFDAPLFAIAKSSIGKNSEYVVFNNSRKLKRASNMADVLEVFKHT
ncbi:MAG: DUF2794 domain-containing protein, partial [Alphaproteobacteria bacterium]|nr:DUF2794 domain-containing protein [Alphaproteobacteria bacterium]